MNISVLGTGNVGRTLATAWIGAGHDVTVGARDPDNATAAQWAAETGGAHGAFADVAEGAEVVVNATPGMVSGDVLTSCGTALDGKPVLDVSNALDFSQGFPPRLMIPDGGSLAEQLQGAHPTARIVKGLNTMAVEVMVAPDSVPGDHVALICGEHAPSKATVTGLIGDLGWPRDRVLDLGGLDAARGLEMWLPLWLRLYGHFGHPMFNVALPRSPNPAPRG